MGPWINLFILPGVPSSTVGELFPKFSIEACPMGMWLAGEFPGVFPDLVTGT